MTNIEKMNGLQALPNKLAQKYYINAKSPLVKHLLTNRSTYQYLTNGDQAEFIIAAHPDCNIRKIDDKFIHIKSEQSRIKITRDGDIYIKERNYEEEEESEEESEEERFNSNINICELRKTEYDSFPNSPNLALNKIIQSLDKIDSKLPKLLKRMESRPNGYKCIWKYKNNIYQIICLGCCYIILKNNEAIQVLSADESLMQGDSDIEVYLMNGKHILIWNRGDIFSVILFKSLI